MTWSGASAVTILAALLAAAPARAATCTKDAECSSGSKCQSGKCVHKTATGSTAPSTDSKSANPAASSRSSAADPAASPVASTAKSPAPTNAGLPSIAIFGLYEYGGFGLGARLEYPVLLNAVKEIQWRNDIFVVGGVEYFTHSYDFSGFGGAYSFRVNYIRIDAGAMWNFWFLDNFAAYPKLTLGYDVAWISGNTFGNNGGYGSGVAFEGAVGVIYLLTPTIQLRGEVGTSSLKVGVGFHF